MNFATATRFLPESPPYLVTDSSGHITTTTEIHNAAEVTLMRNIQGDGLGPLNVYFTVIVADNGELIPFSEWRSSGFTSEFDQHKAAELLAAAKQLPHLRQAGYNNAQIRYCADTIAYLTNAIAHLPGVRYQPVKWAKGPSGDVWDGRWETRMGEIKYELTATGGGTPPGMRQAATATAITGALQSGLDA